jgi:cytochrome P450
LPAQDDVDFVAHVARIVTGRSACVFMGLDPSHADRLVLETWPILPLLIGLPMPKEQEAALIEGARPMLRRLRRLLGDAAARCPDDGEEAGEKDGAAGVLAGELFSDAEAYGWNAVFMFAAAYATNLLSLGNIMRLALSIEGVWHLLASRPDCAQAVVSELMRLDPAVHGIQRYVAQDVMVAQHRFRRGESVFVMVGAANRDPQSFAEPESFRPGRRGRTLAFGNGPHSCMGAGLARQLLANVLTATARRWPALSLAPRAGRGIQVGVFTGYESLWVNSAPSISHTRAREWRMHRTGAS